MIRTEVKLVEGDGNFNIPVEMVTISLFPGTAYATEQNLARREPVLAEQLIQEINTQWMPGIIQTLLRQSRLKMTRLDVDYAIKTHVTSSKPVLVVTINPPTVKDL